MRLMVLDEQYNEFTKFWLSISNCVLTQLDIYSCQNLCSLPAEWEVGPGQV